MQFADLLDNNNLLFKNLSKAQLATAGVSVVSPRRRFGDDQFANGLGGFANVSGKLADVSWLISLMSYAISLLSLSSFVCFEIATIKMFYRKHMCKIGQKWTVLDLLKSSQIYVSNRVCRSIYSISVCFESTFSLY